MTHVERQDPEIQQIIQSREAPEGEPKTHEAIMDTNIREDTPNIMVSNEDSSL